MLTAKLFKNGQSQAVRLPKEFRLKGDQVYIKREGNLLILIPMESAWDSFLQGLDEFSEDCFSEPRVQPPQDLREAIE